MCVGGEGAPTAPLPPHATLPHWQERESYQMGALLPPRCPVLTAVLSSPLSPPGDKEPRTQAETKFLKFKTNKQKTTTNLQKELGRGCLRPVTLLPQRGRHSPALCPLGPLNPLDGSEERQGLEIPPNPQGSVPRLQGKCVSGFEFSVWWSPLPSSVGLVRPSRGCRP